MMNSCGSLISDLSGKLLLYPITFLLCSFAVHAQNTPTPAQLFVVNGIVISGNSKTKERVIKREVVLSVGDTLGKDHLYQDLERSRQNILNLGLFNTVSVIPLFVNERDILVQITVDERWYIWPSPIFELAETNFNTWWLTRDFSRTNYGGYVYLFNTTGNNDPIYAKFQFGYTQEFALEYRTGFLGRSQKWLSKTGWSFSQNAEITVGTQDNKRIFRSIPEGNSREETKFYQEFMYRNAHDTRHIFRFDHTQVSVIDTFGNEFSDYFNSGRTETNFFSFQYTFLLDRRDEKRFARDGHFLRLSMRQDGFEFASKSLPPVTSTSMTAINWNKLSKNLTLASSIRYKQTWQREVPYYLQEGLGYDDFVRGYEFFVIDGQDFALLKENLHFPIIQPFETQIDQIPIRSFRSLYSQPI